MIQVFYIINKTDKAEKEKLSHLHIRTSENSMEM